jgi:hypothetical protein
MRAARGQQTRPGRYSRGYSHAAGRSLWAASRRSRGRSSTQRSSPPRATGQDHVIALVDVDVSVPSRSNLVLPGSWNRRTRRGTESDGASSPPALSGFESDPRVSARQWQRDSPIRSNRHSRCYSIITASPGVRTHTSSCCGGTNMAWCAKPSTRLRPARDRNVRRVHGHAAVGDDAQEP